ncbi:MAG: methyltransferase domain-containing protein [Alphaproteobacteria bacterium]|nr:MAG: methyltransferase domain-containing protein [Alphaproteobacteria bacterium]
MLTEDIRQEMGRATALQRQGRNAEAVGLYRAILKKNNRIAEAHYNLALILRDDGKAQGAEKSFKAAVKLNPSYGRAWTAYARFLGARGKHRDAVRAGLAAVKASNQSAASLQELAFIVEAGEGADLGGPGDEALVLCLSRADVEADGIVVALLNRLRRHAAFEGLLDPGLDEQVITARLAEPSVRERLLEALTEPVLAAALSGILLPSREMGILLAALRSRFDKKAVAERLEEAALIALQLELGEYVLVIPGDAPDLPPEKAGLLDALLSALYRPLPPELAARFLGDEAEVLKELPYARELLSRLGPRRQKETKLAANLPVLGESADTVSAAVRAQYEESPYPRWRGLRAGGEISLQALSRQLFPHHPPMALPMQPAVLVAGAGTGRHALRTAIRIEGAEVTAIDLSAASLGYAAREAGARGMSNIRFALADILALPDDFGPFDLIECCGVLHHMADPEGAWKGLLKVLAPKGVMKIALYSEQARQDVVAVRARLGEDKIKSLSLDEMRALRRELLSLPFDDPAADVTRELDFYSLSGCRDLLFNRQEQRFDIPRIEGAIKTLDLEFLGFEFVSLAPLAAYRAYYPMDPAATNLANWAAFEAEKPMLFRGMYQFWCRRRN